MNSIRLIRLRFENFEGHCSKACHPAKKRNKNKETTRGESQFHKVVPPVCIHAEEFSVTRQRPPPVRSSSNRIGSGDHLLPWLRAPAHAFISHWVAHHTDAASGFPMSPDPNSTRFLMLVFWRTIDHLKSVYLALISQSVV